MPNSTIRHRLLIWYATTTVVVFAVIAAILTIAVRQILFSQIDHHLRVVVGEASYIAETHQNPERDLLLKRFSSEHGMVVFLENKSGKIIYRADFAGSTVNPPPFTENTSEIQLISNNNTRYIIKEVSSPDGPLFVVVGQWIGELTNTVYKITLLIISSLLAGIFFTALGLKRLLRKELQPLEEAGQISREITSSGNLSLRVPESSQSEEVGSLIATLNEMLAKVESIIETEREFFTSAAHTLKTPLAVLRAKIENGEVKSVPEKNSSLNIIDNAAKTVNDLLLLSRVEAGIGGKDVKTIPLSMLVEEIVELAEVLSEEQGLAVKSSVAPGLRIRGDEALLKRSFAALLENAIAYTPRGGQITIKAFSSPEGKVKVIVKDNGLGIPVKDLKRIFDRFYRGQNVSKIPGTGLGLSLVKAAVESQGGLVVIHSKEHKGTEVELTFQAV